MRNTHRYFLVGKTVVWFLKLAWVLCLTTVFHGQPLFAQQSYALKPYSVTLPKLSTSQQNSLASGEAGSLVYNTDAQKVAIHDGSGWQYLVPEATQYSNKKVFTESGTWIVPAGVSKILVEAWGAGGGGGKATFSGAQLNAAGGGGGSYGRGILIVAAGSTINLTIGTGGSGGTALSPAFAGGSTIVNTPFEFISAGGGDASGNPGYKPTGTITFGVGGGAGSNATISYGQKSATEFIQLIKCGNGGTSFGSEPAGFGAQFALTSSSTLLYSTDEYYIQKGAFPGGGGGSGFSSGGRGGDGMVIIHW